MDTNILRNAPEKVARDLRVLEDRLRHELMPDEERQELRDRVLKLWAEAMRGFSNSPRR